MEHGHIPPLARRRRRRLTLVPVLVAWSMALAACGDGTTDNDASGDSAAPTTASASGDTTPTPTGDGTTATDGAGVGTTTATPFDEVALSLTPVVTVNQPTALVQLPGSDDLYLAERGGRIRRVERTIDTGRGVEQVKLITAPVLDLSDQITTEGEGGLLGLAVAPDGGELYVHYTDDRGDTVVAAYPVASGPDGATIDPTGARTLVTADQPYSNHNGGDLQIGPDGLLYISLGDGGGGGDPERTGQDPTDLLGSILRIDPTPSGADPYTIPADNPFADGADGAPEVWLYGARNPWRISFDTATGDLWVGDVGQNAIEEIDFLPAVDGGGRGVNLGWNLMEGDEPYEGGEAPPDHVGPVHTYNHDDGRCSVTGGFVHRGPSLPDLDGVYLFGDFCSGEVFGLQGGGTADQRVARLDIDRRAENVISFGQDHQGEVYLLLQGGQVNRLSPQGGGPTIEVRSDNG